MTHRQAGGRRARGASQALARRQLASLARGVQRSQAHPSCCSLGLECPQEAMCQKLGPPGGEALWEVLKTLGLCPQRRLWDAGPFPSPASFP